MEETRKCSKCGNKIEEGVSTEGWWYAGAFSLRQSKSFRTLLGLSSLNQLSKWEALSQIFQQSKNKKGEAVVPLREVKTYRCTTCGFLESYAE